MGPEILTDAMGELAAVCAIIAAAECAVGDNAGGFRLVCGAAVAAGMLGSVLGWLKG